MASSNHSSVLVIGGGVIGGSIALELCKKGVDVTVIDKGAFFREASRASAGMLCPQAELFDSTPTPEIFRKSQALHRDWCTELETLSQVPVNYQQAGMLRVVVTEEEARKLRDKVESIDIGASWLSAEELRSFEPDITQEAKGAVFFGGDGHLHPVRLAKSLHVALTSGGVKLYEWVPALRLLTENGRVIGANTPNGNYTADYTILAGGAWSSSLVEPLGLHMPVVPVKGQMFAVKCDGLSLRGTVQGPGGMIIPRQDGTFTVGVTHVHAGFDKKPTVEGISTVHSQVEKFIPKLHDAEFRDTWAGLRPGTPDGLPYIGQWDGMDGLIVATGHYTVGVFLAPVTAVTVSQLVTGDVPGIDLTPFRVDRFQAEVKSEHAI